MRVTLQHLGLHFAR